MDLNKDIKDGEEFTADTVSVSEPKTNEDIRNLLKQYDLEHKFEKIKPLIKNKIDLFTYSETEDNIKAGQSKIGGKPDLKDINHWPKSETGKPLSFIAQINCEEASEFDLDKLLPGHGLISFFYCADQEVWGYAPKDSSRFKVIYTDSLNNLKRTEPPAELPYYSIFKPLSIKFDNSLSIPDWLSPPLDGFFNAKENDRYSEVHSEMNEQMFGYSRIIQNAMELECQLVTNGIDCGGTDGYNDPRAAELAKGAKDWVLLLQITSNEKAEMMWGDSGNLYFWIKKEDLKNKNFDNCWCILQCY